MRSIILAFLLSSAVLLAQPGAAPKPPAAAPPKPAAAVAPKPVVPAREAGLYATINTSLGVIVAKLFEQESPITVRNFTALSRGGKAWTDPKTKTKVTRSLYAGTVFHRVIPGFMIQGGDPTGTGMGDGGLEPIPDEFHPTLKFDRAGLLGMANRGPRTGTCQFFITEAPTQHLDGRHTIFGQVVQGQEVVHKIATVPTGQNDKPATPVKIVNIVIKREGPAPAGSTPAVTKKAAPAAVKPPAAVKKAAPVKK